MCDGAINEARVRLCAAYCLAAFGRVERVKQRVGGYCGMFTR
jgi:hypothetical protein